MVVRNRCPATGNEEILVGAAKFAERYDGPTGPAGADGWLPYRPRGVEMLYFMVRSEGGPFSFIAPWGEAMIAKPAGDRARPEQSEGHVSHRGGGVRVHLRDPAPGALVPVASAWLTAPPRRQRPNRDWEEAPICLTARLHAGQIDNGIQQEPSR